MKNITQILLGAVATVVVSSQVMAGDLTIPNSFTSGTPAVAADVNANFTAVETEVDDNNGRINSNTVNISANTSTINNRSGRLETISGANTSLGSVVGTTALVSPVTITVPTNGFLLMYATFEADLGNASGDAAVDLQFNMDAALVGPVWRHAWPLAQEHNAVSVHYAQAVSAGSHDIGLQATVADGFVNVDNPVITAIFVPLDSSGGTPIPFLPNANSFIKNTGSDSGDK